MKKAQILAMRRLAAEFGHVFHAVIPQWLLERFVFGLLVFHRQRKGEWIRSDVV
jgi:hypothetical protein